VDYSRRPWTVEGLATYERMLAQRAPSPFALGAAPGVADICITGQVVEAHYLKLELGAYPAVAALADRCFATRYRAINMMFGLKNMLVISVEQAII
jgi:glutathione S-transferase